MIQFVYMTESQVAFDKFNLENILVREISALSRLFNILTGDSSQIWGVQISNSEQKVSFGVGK
ncbi:MAG: hypothetical protein Kow0031_12110 [Anaerolineae bacterium]